MKAIPSRSWLVASYVALGAIWVGFSKLVVLPLIVTAYQDSGRSFLTQALHRRMHRPLGHYVGLWSDFSGAMLLAMALHLALLLLALSSGSWPETAVVSWRRFLVGRVAILVYAALVLLFAVVSGARHDYVAFLDIWHAINRGDDPWRVDPNLGYSLNAYGPLFNLLAIPAGWISLAPKLLFAAAYLASVIHLARLAGAGDRDGLLYRRTLAALIGPFYWVEIAYFGHFDILVAIACVVAVLSTRADREGRAGFSLALGVLLKYIPLAMLPFLALDGRHVRRRLLWIALATIAGGMLLGYAIWGPTLLRPLRFAGARGSNFASIFRFLRGAYSPLRLVVESPDLDWLSVPAMLVFGLLVFLVCQFARTDPETSAVLAIVTALMFYKVGFLQYQVIVFLLLAFWSVRHSQVVDADPALRWAIRGYLAWYTVLDLVYCSAGGVIHPGDPLDWLDDVAGLPSFLLGALLLGTMLRAALRGRTPSTPASVASHLGQTL